MILIAKRSNTTAMECYETSLFNITFYTNT